jgi:hypothetical protein
MAESVLAVPDDFSIFSSSKEREPASANAKSPREQQMLSFHDGQSHKGSRLITATQKLLKVVSVDVDPIHLQQTVSRIQR